MHPVITIFCSFTRQWAVDGWIENLRNTTHDPALTNLCVIIDANEWVIATALQKFAKEQGYRSFHMKVNEDWQPNEVRLAIRRMRVADVKNQSKDLIIKTDGELIVGLEDDTVFERDPGWLLKLLEIMQDGETGYIEGVQMGRWGANMVGVWQFYNVEHPSEVKTLLPPDNKFEDIQEITAGGFYGYVTRRSLYLNHEYYTSSAQPWGPDVNFGVWVKQQGFRCWVHWGVVFGHRDFTKILYPDNGDVRLAQIVYNKNEITGKWERTDYERDNY